MCSQGDERHSSTSVEESYTTNSRMDYIPRTSEVMHYSYMLAISQRDTGYYLDYLPRQVLLSLFSEYPLLQEHTKLSAVSVQTCSHGDDVHSSLATAVSFMTSITDITTP